MKLLTSAIAQGRRKEGEKEECERDIIYHNSNNVDVWESSTSGGGKALHVLSPPLIIYVFLSREGKEGRKGEEALLWSLNLLPSSGQQTRWDFESLPHGRFSWDKRKEEKEERKMGEYLYFFHSLGGSAEEFSKGKGSAANGQISEKGGKREGAWDIYFTTDISERGRNV